MSYEIPLNTFVEGIDFVRNCFSGFELKINKLWRFKQIEFEVGYGKLCCLK